MFAQLPMGYHLDGNFSIKSKKNAHNNKQLFPTLKKHVACLITSKQ
jgi:hypothetical protein